MAHRGVGIRRIMNATIEHWIYSLPDSWNDWKRDFSALSERDKEYFYQAVEDAGVSNFEQFLEYMELC